MQDYYKILNINKSASTVEIKKAYRQAALFWHPDKNKSINAHEKFIEISEAYSILISPEKRTVYDKLYSAYFSKKVDIAVYSDTKHEYKVYSDWVKEAKVKAEKMAFSSIDSALTETFHFIDKYGWVIIIVVMGLFFLIMSIVMKK